MTIRAVQFRELQRAVHILIGLDLFFMFKTRFKFIEHLIVLEIPTCHFDLCQSAELLKTFIHFPELDSWLVTNPGTTNGQSIGLKTAWLQSFHPEHRICSFHFFVEGQKTWDAQSWSFCCAPPTISCKPQIMQFHLTEPWRLHWNWMYNAGSFSSVTTRLTHFRAWLCL